MNAQVMISVWPKFYPETANYKELDAAGFIYRKNVEDGFVDWIGTGYKNAFYDPYSPAARAMYWRQVQEKLGVLGFDAWWMDATEPDPHSNLDIQSLKDRNGPTAMGPAEQFFNTYALVHSGGVYEGARAANPDKRQYILTRSGTAGIQRHAATLWSGDIVSRWPDLYNQISSAVSINYSGIPNWTFDIGGFATEARYNAQPMKPADQEEWRELNLRWFQMGAFVPVFRSHGQFPTREIFNLAPAGSEVYDSLVWHTKLRYRLMPYIYTLAADTYHRDGSIVRGLPMDFPGDAQARKVRDEYLFGNAFLVAPVYEYQARSRPVYLPAGADWYDFNNGATAGGQTIEAAAPLSRMPLYVRAGSIVPVGPDIQYTAEKPGAPITLFVFTGADGSFDLYEDDGVSYGYEKGQFSRIPLRYDAAKGSADHRRAHRQLPRHARGAHIPRALDQGRRQAARGPRCAGRPHRRVQRRRGHDRRRDANRTVVKRFATGGVLANKGVHRGENSRGCRSAFSAGGRVRRRDRRPRASQADSRAAAPHAAPASFPAAASSASRSTRSTPMAFAISRAPRSTNSRAQDSTTDWTRFRRPPRLCAAGRRPGGAGRSRGARREIHWRRKAVACTTCPCRPTRRCPRCARWVRRAWWRARASSWKSLSARISRARWR